MGNGRSPRNFPVHALAAIIKSSNDAADPLQSVASGTVVLEVALDETGKNFRRRVVREIDSLNPQSALLRQRKFQAAKMDKKPARSKVPVAFSFVPPNVGPRF